MFGMIPLLDVAPGASALLSPRNGRTEERRVNPSLMSMLNWGNFRAIRHQRGVLKCGGDSEELVTPGAYR
jgi:hypothetical protein